MHDVNGGQIWYQLNCTGDFVQVTTTESGDDYEPISLTDELGSASSIAIKFVPSEGYQLDTTRGVKLSVNGNVQFSVTGDDTEGFVGVSGYELEFADYPLIGSYFYIPFFNSYLLGNHYIL